MTIEPMLFILIVGTDPASGKGGIANALPGYLQALDAAGISYKFVVSHKPDTTADKWKHWLAAFRAVSAVAKISRSNGQKVVAYLHVGGGLPSLFRKSTLAAFLRMQRIPVLAQIHGPEVAGYLESSVFSRIFKLAILPMTGLAVLTPWWEKCFHTAHVSKPIFVIPNPLAPELEEQARKPMVSFNEDQEIRLLTMTRLEKGKGVRLAIEALAKLPENFRLDIAGQGSLEKELRELSKQLELDDRVAFRGWVTGTEKTRLLSECDIFLLPTRLDSFGMGFLEAMAWGKPIVAAKWQAIEDVVPNGNAGILVNEFSPQQLARALIQLEDNKVRHAMGTQGKKWVLQHYSIKAIGKYLQQALEQQLV